MEKVGIRLNRPPPEISISMNKTGGVRLLSTHKLTHIDERGVKNIFAEYKVLNYLLFLYKKKLFLLIFFLFLVYKISKKNL